MTWSVAFTVSVFQSLSAKALRRESPRQPDKHVALADGPTGILGLRMAVCAAHNEKLRNNGPGWHVLQQENLAWLHCQSRSTVPPFSACQLSGFQHFPHAVNCPRRAPLQFQSPV